MCTAITFHTKDHYFGRTLDFEYSYNESITIMPRDYPFHFRNMPSINRHFGIIGMATVDKDYPLYYDATNEKGLSMAGLYFPGNAVYLSTKEGFHNIASFEFIPWILCQCKNVTEAERLIRQIRITNIAYSDAYPPSPLHWIIADQDRCVTVEPLSNGLRVYNNPIGVLTNNPPFDYHIYNLANYLNITREEVSNRFAPTISITPYSRGMGAMGLPGDMSSASRFVRATFAKLNSECDDTENSSVSQFFHILNFVIQLRGGVKVGNAFENTIYTSCCNADKGIYYYTTYENSQITAVSMHNENLDGQTLSSYPLQKDLQVRFEN